jgi:hypothetical protein
VHEGSGVGQLPQLELRVTGQHVQVDVQSMLYEVENLVDGQQLAAELAGVGPEYGVLLLHARTS